jgi:hypothetical protein
MPFLLLPPIAAIMALGCLGFFLCAAIPTLRPAALAVPLWFAVWGLLSPTVLIFNAFALGILTQSHANEIVPLNPFALHHLKSLVLVNAVLISGVATAVTLIHGWVLRRITLALFRLYLTTIAAGISLLCSLLILLVLDVYGAGRILMAISFLLTLLVTSSCTLLCYRRPAGFRSSRPTKFQPVSLEEYVLLKPATNRSDE